MLHSSRAGRVVRFAPFNVNAREALAARLGLLPFQCPPDVECPLLAQSGHSLNRQQPCLNSTLERMYHLQASFVL